MLPLVFLSVDLIVIGPKFLLVGGLVLVLLDLGKLVKQVFMYLFVKQTIQSISFRVALAVVFGLYHEAGLLFVQLVLNLL